MVNKRFTYGLRYVEATLQAYQPATTIIPLTHFPFELEIDEIGVTIDERSDDYTVDDKAIATRVTNPYARVLDNINKPVVRALGRRDIHHRPQETGGYQKYRDKKASTPRSKNTQICKACMGVGHCITNTDTICYVIAKAHICNRFVSDTSNAQLIKSNAYRYRKDQKETVLLSKTTTRMDGIIRRMVGKSHTDTQLVPMIQMANAMVDNYYDDSNSKNERIDNSE